MPDWIPTIVGGVVLGLASLIMLVGIGRIAGVSGFIMQAMKSANERLWRLSFIVGTVLGGVLYTQLPNSLDLPAYSPTFELDSIWYVIAGLLVGLGTGIGSGCTSGHGICGLSRLSARSLVAVAIFMLIAMITASVFHNAMRA